MSLKNTPITATTLPSKVQVQRNGLPEGTYRLCFQLRKSHSAVVEDTQLSANLHHQISAQWLLRADLVHSRQREDRVYLWFPTDNKPIGPSGLMNRQVGDWHARLRGGLGRIEAVGEFAALGW